MIHPSILILFASIFVSIASSAIEWLLIYRSDKYKELKTQIDGLTERIAAAKEAKAIGSGNAVKLTKRIERMEEDLTIANRNLSTSKMKSALVVGVTMIVFFQFLSSTFYGRIVAKLPFEPIGLISGLSHRGIAGSDLTDCGFSFLYVLSSITIRSVVQKVMGVAPASSSSTGSSFLGIPLQQPGQ